MAIQFEKVSFSYRGVKDERYPAITEIDLKINEGDFLAICGHTGSGKSTLVQHMNALLRPNKGRVNIFDYTLPLKKKQKLGPIRKKVGLVFQLPEYQLFEETILKDVMFGPLNFGLKEDEAKEKAISACELLEIPEELYHQSPFRISGGQMRKVAIAGILAMEPEVLVLDEPTRGLDPRSAYEVMQIFNKLHQEHGKTIVLVSHDMNLISEYAKRVVVMKKGRIVFDGSKEELFEAPQFNDFSLAKPEALKLMDYLHENLNIPYKYVYSDQELLAHLKEYVGE